MVVVRLTDDILDMIAGYVGFVDVVWYEIPLLVRRDMPRLKWKLRICEKEASSGELENDALDLSLVQALWVQDLEDSFSFEVLGKFTHVDEVRMHDCMINKSFARWLSNPKTSVKCLYLHESHPDQETWDEVTNTTLTSLTLRNAVVRRTIRLENYKLPNLEEIVIHSRTNSFIPCENSVVKHASLRQNTDLWFPKLQSLQVSYSNFDIDEEDQLISALTKMPDLESVGLTFTSIQGRRLGEWLGGADKLEKLGLTNTALQFHESAAFARRLATHKTLKELDLSFSANIATAGLKCIIDALDQNLVLEVLSMCSTNLQPHLGLRLAQSIQRITKLDLYDNNIGAEAASILLKNKTLSYLNIGGNYLWGEDLVPEDFLSCTIETLKLDDNNRDGQNDEYTLVFPATSLQHSTYLSFNSLHFDQPSFKSVCDILSMSQVLTTLSLRFARIGHAFDVLAEALSRNTSLQNLFLGGNITTIDMFSPLIDSIVAHPCIKELDLSTMALDDQYLPVLQYLIMGTKTISTLDLGQNRLTITSLLQVHPGFTISKSIKCLNLVSTLHERPGSESDPDDLEV